MTAALGRCPHCGADGTWRIDRRGDAAVSWTCAAHLSAELEALQRHWEVTELVVVLAAKMREWAQVGASLDEIALGICHYGDQSGPACGDPDGRRLTHYLEMVECAACRLVIAARTSGAQ